MTIEATSPYDVAFVGSGLSSSYSLMQLLDELGKAPIGRPVRIAVIEKDEQFFTGIPYGGRSGATSLIITPLDEFLPSPEIETFMAWLAENRERVFEDIRAKGGPLSRDLLDRCTQAVANGDCSAFHIPRYFFGIYLAETVEARLDQATKRGLVECDLVRADVLSIARNGDGYHLALGDGRTIESRLAVLALGTPPNRTLFEDDAAACTQACLIEDPYLPNLEANLDRMVQSLTASGAEAGRHVVIVGANASGLEMLYTLMNTPALRALGLSVDVLTPQGKLPDRFRQIDAPRFDPTHLKALYGRDGLTAETILDAVKADLAEARVQSLGIADTLPRISEAVGRLVQELDPGEKKIFVRHVGIEIGRLQRRAGEEYSDVADDLLHEGRLRLVTGRFAGLADNPAGGVDVAYTSPEDGGRHTLPVPADLVINCTGSAGMSRPNASPLIEQLLASGLARANESGAGFLVNDRMEAADNLYVIGPLLAGNVVGELPIWHVEHCGRIIGFSRTLAAHLHGDLRSMSDGLKGAA